MYKKITMTVKVPKGVREYSVCKLTRIYVGGE